MLCLIVLGLINTLGSSLGTPITMIIPALPYLPGQLEEEVQYPFRSPAATGPQFSVKRSTSAARNLIIASILFGIGESLMTG